MMVSMRSEEPSFVDDFEYSTTIDPKKQVIGMQKVPYDMCFNSKTTRRQKLPSFTAQKLPTSTRMSENKSLSEDMEALELSLPVPAWSGNIMHGSELVISIDAAPKVTWSRVQAFVSQSEFDVEQISQQQGIPCISGTFFVEYTAVSVRLSVYTKDTGSVLLLKQTLQNDIVKFHLLCDNMSKYFRSEGLKVDSPASPTTAMLQPFDEFDDLLDDDLFESVTDDQELWADQVKPVIKDACSQVSSIRELALGRLAHWAEHKSESRFDLAEAIIHARDDLFNLVLKNASSSLTERYLFAETLLSIVSDTRWAQPMAACMWLPLEEVLAQQSKSISGIVKKKLLQVAAGFQDAFPRESCRPMHSTFLSTATTAYAESSWSWSDRASFHQELSRDSGTWAQELSGEWSNMMDPLFEAELSNDGTHFRGL